MFRTPMSLPRQNWLATPRKSLISTRETRRARLEIVSLEDRTVPASFIVSTTDDTLAVELSTGLDASGNISLRSAIQAANYLGGSNTISLPAGTYTLSLGGANEDDA